jgi:N-acetylmuramoyl-L-alanine amidase
MRVVISSGHGKKIRGASCDAPWGLDEVDEARKVVESVATALRSVDIDVTTYHDDVSTSQSENLGRIVDFHNSKTRDLDISVHFNAYEETSKPMGTEVLYVSSTGMEIADEVVDAIADAGDFINRGPKKRTDLAFLNNTEEPSILIETCFVDSEADAELYRQNYDLICDAIAGAIAGEPIGATGEPEPPPTGATGPTGEVLFQAKGKCSWFGGPDDTGVSPSEGLAFIFKYEEAPHLFLPKQPPATTGLARRLDPEVFYVACRWNYDDTPKTMLRDSGQLALVTAKKTGKSQLAYPADWGPHEDTQRVADLSPGLMEALGLTTDDEVVVSYPDELQDVQPEVKTVTITIDVPAGVRVVINGETFE